MEIKTEIITWPETLFEESEDRREDGIHLSHIIKSLMNRTGMYKGKGGFRDMELAGEIGALWERVLSKVMKEKYASRPPQILKDGVLMSPDGIAPDPEGEVPLVIEEYKATWQSSNRLLTDNFYYMAQVKSYCLAIETNVAVMRVFYLMGDYKGSGPLYRVARIKFSEVELNNNWNMILRERDRIMKEE